MSHGLIKLFNNRQALRKSKFNSFDKFELKLQKVTSKSLTFQSTTLKSRCAWAPIIKQFAAISLSFSVQTIEINWLNSKLRATNESFELVTHARLTMWLKQELSKCSHWNSLSICVQWNYQRVCLGWNAIQGRLETSREHTKEDTNNRFVRR